MVGVPQKTEVVGVWWVCLRRQRLLDYGGCASEDRGCWIMVGVPQKTEVVGLWWVCLRRQRLLDYGGCASECSQIGEMLDF